MAYLPTHNPNGPSEWDGKPKNLPPEGEVFIYNNKACYWTKCPCGCKRPLVLSENGQRDYGLTLMARGENVGIIEVEILELLGYSREEIIQILESGNIEDVQKMIDTKMILDPDGTRKIIGDFLKSKITEVLGNILDSANFATGLGLTNQKPSFGSILNGPFSNN